MRIAIKIKIGQAFLATAVGCFAFSALAASDDPETVGRRIIRQLLDADPEGYKAKGCDGDGYERGSIHYSVVSLWLNAIAFAAHVGDRDLSRALIGKFEPFFPGGARAHLVARAKHVDHAVFGALPLEIYLQTGDVRAREMGLAYADGQWAPPKPEDVDTFPEFIRGHFVPIERQRAYFADGYTGQTRLWIDDMYMINVLQTQAYRATGDGTYLARAAREMALYLDKLQLGSGLFNHTESVPFRWARGNGWMAAGMPMILRYLDESDPNRARILAGYRKMMAALLPLQRDDGFWCQLVDDPKSWPESSGTAMFAFAFLEGVKHGWLDAATYREPAMRAYRALVASMDEHGNVRNVCIGTNALNDRAHYLARRRLTGDPHGQAPLLWIVNSLLSTPVTEPRLRTPETSGLFVKRVDPASKVVSYLLKPGLLGWNQQGLYYTAQPMSDDGRFLILDVADDERKVRRRDRTVDMKTKAFVDFLKDRAFVLPGTDGGIPFFDPETAKLYYTPRDKTKGTALYRVCMRDLRADPLKEIVLCAIPGDIFGGTADVGRWYTHLTLTRDRRKAFFDAGSNETGGSGKARYIQGVIDLATGAWTRWNETSYCCNHGALNPADDTLAFVAQESCWEGLKPGDVYPRLHLLHADGRDTMIPPAFSNYATHESWTHDGRGLIYCPNSVVRYDLATGAHETICPLGAIHATVSRNERYVVFDQEYEKWWRGCPWKVSFWNRDTGRKVDVYSKSGALTPDASNDRQLDDGGGSSLHADAHPAFACRDRYVVSTFNSLEEPRMNLCVTPVAQLIAMTAGPGDERDVWDLSETSVRLDRFECDHSTPGFRRAVGQLKEYLTKRTGVTPKGTGRLFIIGWPALGEPHAAPGEGCVKIQGGKAFLWGDCEKAVELLVSKLPAEGNRIVLHDGRKWSTNDASAFDPKMALSCAVVDNDGVKWIDGRHLPLEGKAFQDTELFYDRLPSNVTSKVNSGVRALKHHSAGLQFRFKTTSKFLNFRWTPINSKLEMGHMPASGVSGIDVYRQYPNGDWVWVATGFAAYPTGTLNRVSVPPGTPICVNLPLYNGIRSFEVGIDPNATIDRLPPRRSGIEKPVVVYGTSITQGGCASRPGMNFVSIMGRRLDVPVVNLGFSGSGGMELEMSEHLAKIDASCYVLDCVANMGVSRPPADYKGYRHPGFIDENYEPFVRNLRRLRPDVPIVMAEQGNVHCGDVSKNKLIRAIHEKLKAEGWTKLVLLRHDRMMPSDCEGTVDGSHANDYGMVSLAEAYGAAVKEALGL